ncbi:Sec-independent protein translocase protein TatB [Jeongeupia sp. HS-3]|uniref:Sec-independent protein translocase subunit TatA/TatB n=1 Tax=Jeongeupia sp. HS-3 TaxID=1009682 RepID=UPI0018A5E706|nr:twin-arginine translocase TatA/TatE family subunit [Jeongeupia sp. HS-3]BCL77159.1 Sec-independent protein translocase protein TatB [Jeongeupia sp. HS-3]
MFDVSLGELAVIGAVALVVIGPERLPTVARTVGALIGRGQRFVSSVKADLEREVRASELMQIEAELRAEGDALRQTIQAPMAELRETLADTQATLSGAGALSPASASGDAVPTPIEPAAAPATEAPASDTPGHDERQLDLLFAETNALPPPASDRR